MNEAFMPHLIAAEKFTECFFGDSRPGIPVASFQGDRLGTAASNEHCLVNEGFVSRPGWVFIRNASVPGTH